MVKQFSIKCGKIINSSGILKNSYINIKEKTIESIGYEPAHSEVVDHGNDIAFPGFIDIHTHGYYGVDASFASSKELHYWAKLLAKNGVTSFIPTCVSLPNYELKKFIDNVKEAMKHQLDSEARIIGARSEGPFISLKRKGAHNSNYIREIDLDEIQDIIAYGKGVLKIIDMAPEIKNFSLAMPLFYKNGIIVSIGHTDSDYFTSKNALSSGVKLITHFYNAMTQFDHRNPGAVGAGFLSSNANLEIISDFHHVSRESIEVMIKNAGYDYVIEITDSLSIGGTGNKDGNLGGIDIEVKDGVVYIKNTDKLAGSVLTMHQAYLNLKSMDIQPVNISKLLSYNVSQLLNINNGDISPGKIADICFIDNSDKITDTLVSGKSTSNCENGEE